MACGKQTTSNCVRAERTNMPRRERTRGAEGIQQLLIMFYVMWTADRVNCKDGFRNPRSPNPTSTKSWVLFYHFA
eukprot:5659360-Amphidinium_carterae.1